MRGNVRAVARDFPRKPQMPCMPKQMGSFKCYWPLVHVQEMVALDYPAPREQIIWCLRRDMTVQPGDVEFAGMDFEKKARIVVLAAVRIVAAVPKGCAGAEITPVPVPPIFSDEHL